MTVKITVECPGVLTTVQDWPGRTGYWQVGVPPSGPMVLSPGAGGMWSADGGKPGAASGILQLLAQHFGAGNGGFFGGTLGKKVLDQTSNALQSNPNLIQQGLQGVSAQRGTGGMSNVLADAATQATQRLGVDPSMIPLGSIGKTGGKLF